MALLLTHDQQQAIKKMSPNNSRDYDQLATEVEELELRDLLGDALLQDLQANPTSENNVKLLDGSTFEDCHGNTIKFKGLRYVLAYFNYAKYIGSSFVKDTNTGFVQKNRQESEVISEGTVNRLQIENRKIGMKEFELVKDYLNANCDTYTLWISTESKQAFAPKFHFIRKTYE